MNLKVNQRVEVGIKREEWKGTYKSRVEDLSGGQITIGIPYSQGHLIPLRVGEEVLITYYDNVAVYRFAALISKVQTSPIAVFSVGEPQNLERIQRRDFVRVDVKLPCLYKPVGEERATQTYTLDIGGGGVRFAAAQETDPGTKLELLIDLNKQYQIRCLGEVIRTIPTDNKQFEVCIKFVEMDEKLKDKLIGWIFSYQLELRKKGLL